LNPVSAPGDQLSAGLFVIQFWCREFSVGSQPETCQAEIRLEAES